MPMDKVVDEVASMGFSRDRVRAVVHRLTENGQAVDLNAVIDALMAEGDVNQPSPGAWYPR